MEFIPSVPYTWANLLSWWLTVSCGMLGFCIGMYVWYRRVKKSNSTALECHYMTDERLKAESVVHKRYSSFDRMRFFTVVSFAMLAVSVLCVSVKAKNVQAACIVLEEEMLYYEGFDRTSVYEDAIIVSKKLEINERLFEAKRNRIAFGDWSMYPESVLHMEPVA